MPSISTSATRLMRWSFVAFVRSDRGWRSVQVREIAEETGLHFTRVAQILRKKELP